MTVELYDSKANIAIAIGSFVDVDAMRTNRSMVTLYDSTGSIFVLLHLAEGQYVVLVRDKS